MRLSHWLALAAAAWLVLLLALFLVDWYTSPGPVDPVVRPAAGEWERSPAYTPGTAEYELRRMRQSMERREWD